MSDTTPQMARATAPGDVIQYYTNNDGSYTEVLNNPAAPPDLRQKAADHLGTTVPPPGTIATDVITDIQDGVPPVAGSVFISQAGAYYKAANRKSPGDALVQFPSDLLLTILDTVTNPDVEITRDAVTAYANAQRGTGG